MKLRSGSGLYDTIDQVVSDGVRRGLGHLSAEDEVLEGRTVRIGGRDLLNLGTASYMHLERHPALIAGAEEMLRRYGTQFSASRAYLQLSLYDQLEDNLGRIFDRPVLATASTTLGHMSAIPVLVGDQDAIILDQQVHSSIQTVVQILKARGVPLHLIRHNRMDELESRIQKLRGKHRTIWYFADGIYSMFGDGAPAADLMALMDRYPQLRCYVDDAHGFGWTGEKGRGWFRSRIQHHPQLVLAVSLNKAYASAGGALVFPNEAEKQRVRNCGPTMIFCGPIQPPMLGAAIAATELHLSDELPALQAQLKARIDHCREGLAARGLPQVEANDTPLYFIPTGMPKLVKEVGQRLMADGLYVNLGIFPAVPASMGGVRFHMHRALALEDVDYFLDRLAVHHKAVLHEEGVTPDKLARSFRMKHLRDVDLTPAQDATPAALPAASPLRVSLVDRIEDVDEAAWDSVFAGHGPFSHAALRTLAPAFAAAPEAGRACARFLMVRDDAGGVVLATFFSTTRVKEDMFASAEISERVEQRRLEEGADFLVTRAVTLGLPVTLGRHLHLDRAHPRWREALQALLAALHDEKEASGATRLLLREFERGADPELSQALMDEGFVEVSMPDMMRVEGATWTDRAGMLASLKGRYRREVRKEILPHVDAVGVEAGPITDPDELAEAYALYQRVHARGRQLNVVALPENVFGAMCASPEFDVLRFHVRDADPSEGEEGATRLGCVMLSHVRGGRYSALLVGFDEALVATHAIYKVALLRTVERARALDCADVNLAFTAEIAKRKVGARPHPVVAHALVDDTFGANVLMNI
jgi:7-keto-8-aminopelargonate synthetase-like enzyme